MTPESLSALLHSRAGREILDLVPIPVYCTDVEGVVTYFNAAVVELAGRAPELGVDRWFIAPKLFFPNGESMPLDECPMANVLKGRDIGDAIQCIGERPDGTRFWFMPSATVLKDAGGRIAGGLYVLVDITSFKVGQSEAQRASLLLSAIVDSSDDAIISKDLNGTITSWNKSAERLFGYTAEEIVGKPVTLLIPPDRQDEEPEIIARLKKGERVDHFETIRRKKDGTLLGISLTISPVRDGDGRIIGASKIARDITERQRIELEVRRVNRDLEQFAFSASHDLQEPLRGIKIYSELLTRRYASKLDGQALEFLGYLRTGAMRMESLVTDLLAYTQVSLSEQEPDIIDANSALSAVLESLRGAIDESKAQITFDALPELRIQGQHFHSLLQNLIGNAIKYRSKERTPAIHISAERRGAEWLFAVRDNGIGIAPQYQDNVFGLFQRLHTSEEYSGTGIGLAICQRIVAQYYGRIWINSEPGTGSTFFFTLPALPTA